MKELENVDLKPKGFGFLKKTNLTDEEVCKRAGLENIKKLSGNLMAKPIAVSSSRYIFSAMCDIVWSG